MSQFVAWIRSEPAFVGALVSIASTMAISFGVKQELVGAIVSAIEAVVAVVVRSQVSPVAPKP